VVAVAGAIGAGAYQGRPAWGGHDRGAANAAEPEVSLEAARECVRLDRARASSDWEAFGEAWTGLRAALGLGSEPASRQVDPRIPRD
jgi:hypothetical protein